MNIPKLSIIALLLLPLALAGPLAQGEAVYIPTPEELRDGDVEIIAGEDRVIYEYRVSGRLMMIKVVPKVGATYYMVPADGEAHYEGLDHKKKLYPQWVIVEF